MSQYGLFSLIAILTLAGGCSRKSATSSHVSNANPAPAIETAQSNRDQSPKLDNPLGKFLPVRAGSFEAGLLENDRQFVRREYSRGSTKISVTIANPGASPVTFDEWVKMSGTSPAVKLDLPSGAAAGFYDCTSPSAAAECNVHIHFRAGFHLEMMGQGNAHRADFDELLSGLPIRGLTKEP